MSYIAIKYIAFEIYSYFVYYNTKIQLCCNCHLYSLSIYINVANKFKKYLLIANFRFTFNKSQIKILL